MAVETFEKIYERLSADEKKVLDSMFAKEPELKKGWLRQDDYSRQSNELTAKQTRYSELERYEAEMAPWAEEAHKRIRTLETAGVIDAEGNDLWSTQKAEYERRINAAVAGGDVDPAELERRVKEIVKSTGVVFNEAELKTLAASEAKRMAEEAFDTKYKEKEKDFNTNTIPFVTGFGTGVALAAMRYEKETGQPWTEEKTKEFFEAMSREQNFSPYQMGEKMLQPFRDKKSREAEIEAEVQKRLSSMGMPGGGGEGYIPQGGQPAPKGALQQWMDRQNGDASMDIEQAVAAQAVKAAEALRSEGKF